MIKLQDGKLYMTSPNSNEFHEVLMVVLKGAEAMQDFSHLGTGDVEVEVQQTKSKVVVTNSKNVVTGTIVTGGSFRLGDG